MNLSYLDCLPEGGFNFDNHLRNEALISKGLMEKPKMTSTGTTIVGVVFDVSFFSPAFF